MANSPDLRRRRLGAIFLALALVMLIAGETVLANRLSPLAFLGYWLGCFLFTALAILVAVLDLAAMRRRARTEEQALVQATLEEIAREKQSQSRTFTPPDGHPHRQARSGSR